MGGLTARYLAFSLAPPSPNIMARARFILAVLVSASFVSLAAGGSTGGESRGRSDCGESSTWTIAAGDTKHCCTSISMNYVDKFEYTTEPVGLFSGSSNIKFSVRESENWVTLGEWTVADADCALDGSAQTCTGSACVVPGSSSDGTCKKEVDISSHDKEDICVVANCTGSSTCTHKVEIMFHHNHFECDDCPLPHPRAVTRRVCAAITSSMAIAAGYPRETMTTGAQNPVGIHPFGKNRSFAVRQPQMIAANPTMAPLLAWSSDFSPGSPYAALRAVIVASAVASSTDRTKTRPS